MEKLAPDRTARSERLRKLTRWAKEIPVPLATLHELHGPTVHLRPTSNGVTLLGLTPGRPQRGKGGFTNLAALVDDFDAVFAKHCTPDEHGRDTPEKELQSALLRDAYAHGRRMEMLGLATRQTKHATPIFVADELALPTDDGGRILCDLFCVRETEDGLLRPMVIELKSERAKKRLIAQVEDFAALVEEQLEGFEALTKTLLRTEKTLRGPCEKWIVWPGPVDAPDRQEKAFSEHRIRLVTYDLDEDGAFTLRAGDAV